jgi:hypothetical protein
MTTFPSLDAIEYRRRAWLAAFAKHATPGSECYMEAQAEWDRRASEAVSIEVVDKVCPEYPEVV